MAEKYTCKACYKKFVATKNSKCPQCGTVVELKSTPSLNGIEELLLAEEDYEDPISTLEDLEYEVGKAKQGVRSLATAFIVLIFSTIVGGAIFTMGTVSNVACALQRQSCSSGSESIGLIIVVVGLLVSIGLAASALVSAKRS